MLAVAGFKSPFSVGVEPSGRKVKMPIFLSPISTETKFFLTAKSNTIVPCGVGVMCESGFTLDLYFAGSESKNSTAVSATLSETGIPRFPSSSSGTGNNLIISLRFATKFV